MQSNLSTIKNTHTCFVIMGYGEKQIPNTFYKVNLDDTYNILIKPVLIADGLISIFSGTHRVHSFRADEACSSQMIDAIFLSALYLADIVIADITALNQNAIYELGIRHAMKPKSTILMCDDKTAKYVRFVDFDHYPYVKYNSDELHDKDKQAIIHTKLKSIIKTCKESTSSYIDSFVFSQDIRNNAQKYLNDSYVDLSLSQKISAAKAELDNENYQVAENLYADIIKKDNYSEINTICDYILAKYKKNITVDNLKYSLIEFKKYVDLNHITHEDAFGIAAAINLQIFKLTNDEQNFYEALNFYRQGANCKSNNLYCARNYCSTLLKVYLVEDNLEIIREYYYTAVHTAKIFLNDVPTIINLSDVWYKSNQSDLMLIATGADLKYSKFNATSRQKTTIDNGRRNLLNDIKNIKNKLGIV